MIPSLKAYPAMKDSGVDTLGAVPEHWEVAKLGHIGRLFKGTGASKEDEVPTGIPCIRYGDLYTRHNYFIHDSRACISEERANRYTPIKYGDVLFAASGETIDEIGKSSVNLIEGEAYCGGDVIIFRANQRVDSRYMGYATDFRLAAIQKARMGRGFTVIHIYGHHLKKLTVPLPPVHEQSDIVRFLDHIDRRFQRYIRAKEKLIALLEEQKHAITHQAVTGQIDVRTRKPYPAYKDSSVAWLGTIPSHWDVLPLKRAFSHMEYGISDSGSDQGTIAVLTMGDVRDGAVAVPSHGGVESVAASLLLQDKDLLFNRTNSAELVGKVGLFRWAERPATFASYLVRLRANAENSPEFLNLLLNDVGFLAAARREAIPSLHQSNLNPTRYGRLQIPLPPEGEQRAIVKSVMRDTSSVDSLLRRTHREIDLIQEHRTRLIADVVTGKLDVRGAGAWPDEMDTATGTKVETELVNTTRASGRARLQHRRA